MLDFMITDEDSWINGIKKGERSALDELYRSFRTPCVQWLTQRHNLHMEDLLDVFQDGVIILYRQIINGKLDHKTASIKTYLFAVCQKLAMKKWQKQHKQSNTGLEKVDISQWNVSVHQHLEENENQSIIRNMIEQLGAPCRDILQLFYYERNAIESIQQKMKYNTTDVVRTQKKRCLTKLRQTLETINRN